MFLPQSTILTLSSSSLPFWFCHISSCVSRAQLPVHPQAAAPHHPPAPLLLSIHQHTSLPPPPPPTCLYSSREYHPQSMCLAPACPMPRALPKVLLGPCFLLLSPHIDLTRSVERLVMRLPPSAFVESKRKLQTRKLSPPHRTASARAAAGWRIPHAAASGGSSGCFRRQSRRPSNLMAIPWIPSHEYITNLWVYTWRTRTVLPMLQERAAAPTVYHRDGLHILCVRSTVRPTQVSW